MQALSKAVRDKNFNILGDLMKSRYPSCAALLATRVPQDPTDFFLRLLDDSSRCVTVLGVQGHQQYCQMAG
jgi:hypothetical protein